MIASRVSTKSSAELTDFVFRCQVPGTIFLPLRKDDVRGSNDVLLSCIVITMW